MMGRIRGIIHFVWKGDVSFSVPVLRLSAAAGPNSSHSQKLATETVLPFCSVWCAFTKNLEPVHMYSWRSLRPQKRLTPHKLASLATRIDRISLLGKVWLTSRRPFWTSVIGWRTRAKWPEKDSGLYSSLFSFKRFIRSPSVYFLRTFLNSLLHNFFVEQVKKNNY